MISDATNWSNEEVRTDVLSNCQEYLAMVQERNRRLKQLQTKDPKQIELERREQGFTIYVNGANSNLPTVQDFIARKVPTTTQRSDKKRAKTADRNREMGIEFLSDDNFYSSPRRDVKTAPEKPQRKKWNIRSVEIKTESGESVKVKPPVILTGRYTDDFDDEVLSDTDDDDDTDDDAGDDRHCLESLSLNIKSVERSKDYSPSVERVSLTIRDVKKLCRSLAVSASIRESLEDGGLSGSRSLLLDESIEEDLSEESDIRNSVSDSHLVNAKNKHSSCEQVLKSTDIIVLELASCSNSVKSQRQLTAAKHKDSDSTDLVLPTEKRTPRSGGGGGGARTPREERAKNRSNQQSTEELRVQKSREILLRPVADLKPKVSSGAAQKSNHEKLDSSEDVRAAMDALAAENRSLQEEKFNSSKNPKQEQDTTVEKRNSVEANGHRMKSLSSSSTDTCSRSPPSTVLSPEWQLELGGGSIDDLVQKVLHLDPKGQQRLLKALQDIEQGVSMSVKTAWHQSKTNNGSSLPAASAVEKDETETRMNTAQNIKICLCIFSNWGHPGRVGLTEIQLFDLDHRKIEVQREDVQVQGAHNITGDMESLFNGKYKTIKEKDMWSCDLQSLNPIRISISIKKPQTDNNSTFGISKLKIWNFNKNAGELNKGVRHMKILKDGDVVFDGNLDRGCGNYNSDYGKTIHFLKSSEGSPGAEDNRKSAQTSNSDWLCLQDSGQSDDVKQKTLVSRVAEEERTEKTSRNTSPELEVKTVKSNSSLKNMKVNKSVCKDGSVLQVDSPSAGEVNNIVPLRAESRPISSHEQHLSSEHSVNHRATVDNKSRSNMAVDKRRDTSPPPSGLLWPASDLSSTVGSQSDDDSVIPMFERIQKITRSQKAKELPSWLNDVDETDELPGSSVGSRTSSRQDNLLANLELEDILELNDGMPKNWNKGRHLSKSHLLSLTVEGLNADDRDDLGRRDLSASPIPTKATVTRAKWNLKPEKSLEESWLSLSLFNRFQKGRLSVDLEDDALEEYLLPVKMKPQEPVIVEESLDCSSDGFVIPELPCGQELVVNILSTWGDKHYVGLNGIEIFTSTGEPAPIAKISADPSDINILPEYSGDPRVVTNLIDGINRTRDDTHMWLAPFTLGQNNLVKIRFQKPVQISLLRIWNYNKSRIHSFRGAKDIEVTLDGRLIFVGEINRSSGGLVGSSEAFGDTILFSTDEEVLELVSRYDQTFEVDIEDEDFGQEMTERPKTADKGDEKSRPFTSASHLRKRPDEQEEGGGTVPHERSGPDQLPKGRCLRLNFTATWGDVHYLGLTGLEVLGRNGESIPVMIDMMDANPRDLQVLPGYETDDRTLDKLIDGTNVTSIDEHMWLIPFTEGENHFVQINFGQLTELSGIRIWNYNKSPEDTYRGARIMHVSLDGCCISPPEGYLIRKGPGICFFDFAQEISFLNTPKSVARDSQKTNMALPVSEDSNDEYEVIQKPCGFIYQLQLLSSWGDPYYLGLNGLEFYNADGIKINLTENNISAYPDSVNVLEGVENDVRTPDKLIDGINDTEDGRHMWLAPILPNVLNRIYVIFDVPVELSMIKVWNYSKMPNRGVKDIALLVDDLLVYNGTLDMVPIYSTGILPNVTVPQRYHTILFTSEKAIMQDVKHTVIRNQATEQEVQLTNDHQVVAVNHKRSAKPVDQALRPTTSVPAHVKRSNRHR